MDSDCSKHKKDVAGITDMKVLAEMVGDLHYEALTDFMICLARKIDDDADVDFDAGRRKISAELYRVAFSIYDAKSAIQKAWEISKPFMK